MHIGEVAERLGLSHRTLRHYDEVGLVPPSGRTEGGFRLYGERDVERLLLIRRMKPLGFALEEMGQLLAVVDRLERDPADAEARERLAEFVTQTAERREALARQVAMADEFARRLDELSA
jgi:MerR family transcriptional regulator, copper efflux regulator